MHLDIYQIEPAPFLKIVQKNKYELFLVSIANIEKALVLKKRTNSALKLSKKYYNYLNIFSQKNANKLPEY